MLTLTYISKIHKYNADRVSSRTAKVVIIKREFLIPFHCSFAAVLSNLLSAKEHTTSPFYPFALQIDPALHFSHRHYVHLLVF